MKPVILVLNCGSSSIKFALYHWHKKGELIASGLAERLQESGANLKIKGALSVQKALPNAGHEQALEAILHALNPWQNELIGIGHRVVHGGEHFQQSQLIQADTLIQLEQINELAPLHNPVNILGIKACQKLMPTLPQVAVFDTAFHQSMPQQAYLYGTPFSWYQENQVRRYGFHGTSFRYISQEAAKRLGQAQEATNLIVAHLGNGCSACAIRQGKSVDTSMGMTPLDGLLMGTRSGSIDPGIFTYIAKARHLSMQDISQILNKQSGLQGVSGISNDMRTLVSESDQGNVDAMRAIDLFCFKAAREMAALCTSLERIDAIVFTGGIGENAAVIRANIIANLKLLNIQIDAKLNQEQGDKIGRISHSDSLPVLVIATNEELMIAQDTFNLTH